VVRAAHIVELYGVRRFLADVDRDRAFWREGGGVVGSLLDWAADEGFSEIMNHYGAASWESAFEFRQRHVLRARSRQGG
jgi:hypothetical protein